MKYLGIARQENGHIVMPDAFGTAGNGRTFEAVEIGGDILLTTTPLDRARLARIEELASLSIKDHQKTLEGLAK